jgi:hypothetical protein
VFRQRGGHGRGQDAEPRQKSLGIETGRCRDRILVVIEDLLFFYVSSSLAFFWDDDFEKQRQVVVVDVVVVGLLLAMELATATVSVATAAAAVAADVDVSYKWWQYLDRAARDVNERYSNDFLIIIIILVLCFFGFCCCGSKSATSEILPKLKGVCCNIILSHSSRRSYSLRSVFFFTTTPSCKGPTTKKSGPPWSTLLCLLIPLSGERCLFLFIMLMDDDGPSVVQKSRSETRV